MENSPIDITSKDDFDEKPLSIEILDLLEHLKERIQNLTEKQTYLNEYLSKEKDNFNKISEYKDIILNIQAIPKYISKTKYLKHKVKFFGEKIDYLSEFSRQIYNKRHDLSEQWKTIKKIEQKKDITRLLAQKSNKDNSPPVVTLKRDVSKVKDAYIED
ncbi:hypothetical protein PNEG_01423 [Pneumocystis murina B123]|uniref:Biogenesis of lysosome-related organelles complex 1 subunit KXD1 n=1 Tax=Pneumocystis murina (strain B123) TaxID=1069680 RepID=M7NN83_PNEMU|nr:hypothetical protein PNEG_01423 [Pneumocystis murina B123]EMR10148.1 hypothetical protein PNEG_01423 [Pneumocystis murina B123]